MRIIKRNLYENEAFVLEERLIRLIGRRDLKIGPLANLTFGGEGTSGKITTKKVKAKLRVSAKRQDASMTDEQRKSKSKKLSDAHKRRIDSRVEAKRVLKISSHFASLSQKDQDKIKAKRLATRLANGWIPREPKRKLTKEELSETRRLAWDNLSDKQKKEILAKRSLSLRKRFSERTEKEKKEQRRKISEGHLRFHGLQQRL